jgi:hypothetical protein
VRVDAGAAFNLLLGQSHIYVFRLPVRPYEGEGRNEHFLPAEPPSGIHYYISDGPLIVVEIEFLCCSELTVGGAYNKTL